MGQTGRSWPLGPSWLCSAARRSRGSVVSVAHAPSSKLEAAVPHMHAGAAESPRLLTTNARTIMKEKSVAGRPGKTKAERSAIWSFTEEDARGEPRPGSKAAQREPAFAVLRTRVITLQPVHSALHNLSTRDRAREAIVP